MAEPAPTALSAVDAPPLLESWFAHLVNAYSPKGKVVVKDGGGALGRGLYALEKLTAGMAVVVEEEPLALIPDLNYDPEISCAHCLRPLGDVAKHVRRMLASESGKEADFDSDLLNHIAVKSVTSITNAPPAACKGGCSFRYCSQGHAELAWASYHRLLCPAVDKTGSISAFMRLVAVSTDRLLLAATVLARVICAAERGGDLGRAWEPFGLMKSMPWERQLVYDDESDTLSDESATKKKVMRTAIEVLTPLMCLREAYKPLFKPAFFSRILGMIDMNACTMGVFSPVECYLVAMDELPEPEIRAAAQQSFNSTLRKLRRRTNTEDKEGLPKVEGVGLFPLQMIVNHSCEPSGEVHKSLWDIDGRVNVVLIKDVEAGQEIFNSYRDFTDHTPYAQRQRQLRAQFNFECKCTRCTRERTDEKP